MDGVAGSPDVPAGIDWPRHTAAKPVADHAVSGLFVESTSTETPLQLPTAVEPDLTRLASVQPESAAIIADATPPRTIPSEASLNLGDAKPASAKPSRVLRTAVRRSPFTQNTPLLISILVHVGIAGSMLTFMPDLVKQIIKRDEPVQFVKITPPVKCETPDLTPPPITENEIPDSVVKPTEAPDVVVESQPVIDLDQPLAQSEVVSSDANVTADWKRPISKATSAASSASQGNLPAIGTGSKPAYVPPSPPVRYVPPAPPAAPKASGPSRSARPKVAIQPSYPESERKAGHESCVMLEVLVDAQGKLTNVRVLSPTAPESFIASAVRAARSARYEPALEEGVPVAGQIVLKVDFRLR